MTRLMVVAGLPGTGKTTLARALAVELDAVFLRVDAVETAVEGATGRPAGTSGYAVVWQVARSNLLLGPVGGSIVFVFGNLAAIAVQAAPLVRRLVVRGRPARAI